MASESDLLLARAALEAEHNAFFIASALATYRSLSEIDNTSLAAFLGCTGTALYRLALCRRPEGEGAAYREEVQRIAQYAGCNAERLATMLRAASASDAMRAAAAGSLLAARDRISDEMAGHDALPDPDGAPDAEDIEP